MRFNVKTEKDSNVLTLNTKPTKKKRNKNFWMNQKSTDVSLFVYSEAYQQIKMTWKTHINSPKKKKSFVNLSAEIRDKKTIKCHISGDKIFFMIKFLVICAAHVFMRLIILEFQKGYPDFFFWMKNNNL